MVKYLAKANDHVLSHCRCEGALASLPGQLDCPWCGCGWLIACSNCRKAFVYAKVVEIGGNYRDHVRADYERRGYSSITEETIERNAIALEEMLAPLKVGDTVVYFDGYYFSIGHGPIKFEGDYAAHDLDRLPHAIALTDAAYLGDVLGDARYWRERERSDRA